MTFETEKDFDLVRIGQGDDPFSSSSTFFEWSGLRVPPPIRSTGDAMWVRLTSDDSLFKDGFELTVTSVIASGEWSYQWTVRLIQSFYQIYKEYDIYMA